MARRCAAPHRTSASHSSTPSMEQKDKSWVTSADVAKRAAVSRTFTPGASVAPETRARVMEAAQSLGRPRSAWPCCARDLKGVDVANSDNRNGGELAGDRLRRHYHGRAGRLPASHHSSGCGRTGAPSHSRRQMAQRRLPARRSPLSTLFRPPPVLVDIKKNPLTVCTRVQHTRAISSNRPVLATPLKKPPAVQLAAFGDAASAGAYSQASLPARGLPTISSAPSVSTAASDR